MRRRTWTGFGSALAILAAAGWLTACDEEAETDAGTDAGPASDAGPGESDAGFDAGAPDAGPPGCPDAEGCEFVQISAAVLHTCGRRENGEVLCWGRNQELQLGDGRTRHMDCAMPGQDPEDCSGEPVNVRFRMGGARPVIDDASFVSAETFSSTCSIRGGELWCWSTLVVGGVGGGISEPRPVAERFLEAEGASGVGNVSVASGAICYVREASGELFCAGNNGFGQVGRGVGVALLTSPAPVVFGTGTLENVVQVALSTNAFACARTSDEVYCWGRGEEGQLGDGVFTHDSCENSGGMDRDCSRDAVLVGDPSGDSLGEVFDLDVGQRHVCAIAGPGPSGQVVCWGDNRAGAIGQADTTQSFNVPTEVAGLDDVVDVSAGTDYSCAVRADGTVTCWGLNSGGQLGDGVIDHGQRCTVATVNEDCSPTPVAVTGIDDAVAVSAGSSHACAIRANGSVWCWGNNNSRQLGDGTETERFEPVEVQGTAPSMM